MPISTQTSPRARASFLALGLAGLSLALPGCIIEGKIGDDPQGDEGAGDVTATSSVETAGSGPYDTDGSMGTLGHTSASPPTATSGAFEDSGAACGPLVDAATAVELCGVPVIPPQPGDPVFQEGVVCEGGSSIDVQTTVITGIFDYAECLCWAVECSHPTGGTTSGPDLPDPAGSESGDPPDGCGPFPPGEAEFTCSCEMCSIDVTSVDADWLDGEADLEAICECMCGGAGCGMPL